MHETLSEKKNNKTKDGSCLLSALSSTLGQTPHPQVSSATDRHIMAFWFILSCTLRLHCSSLLLRAPPTPVGVPKT